MQSFEKVKKIRLGGVLQQGGIKLGDLEGGQNRVLGVSLGVQTGQE